MARAKYKYEVRTDEATKQKIIIIVDENTTGMSVTNDIENVVEEICLQENLNSPLVNVIYKDSDGRWDGYDTKTRTFISLGDNTSQMAIAHLLTLKASRNAKE